VLDFCYKEEIVQNYDRPAQDFIQKEIISGVMPPSNQVVTNVLEAHTASTFRDHLKDLSLQPPPQTL
jgi:hypothetical protein